MCGIVAAKLNSFDRGCRDFLEDGLQKVLHRGYDSWGYAIGCNSTFECIKQVGRPTDIRSDGYIGMAHTRWATNGVVSSSNAHPHEYNHYKNNWTQDDDGELKNSVYVVHNGIIKSENETAISAYLLDEYNYRDWQLDESQLTECDSSLLPALISLWWNEELSVHELSKYIKGCGAFVAIIIDNKTNIRAMFAYSDGSPLYLGTNESGDVFISSELDVLDGYATKFHKLNNDTLINIVNGADYSFWGEEVELNSVSTSLHSNDFMYNEIKEQAEIILKEKEDMTLDVFLSQQRPLEIVGCGSSYNVGLLGELLTDKIIGKSLIHTSYSSHLSHKNFISLNPNYLFISQSGETKDTIDAAYKIMQKLGKMEFEFRSFAITNNSNSTLARICGNHTCINAGKEVGVASTKTFFAAAKLFIDSLGINVSETTRQNIADFIRGFRLDKNLIKEVANYKHILFLGAGLYYPIALEAALKMKEVSYIHAEGMHSYEMKHGPIALIDDSTLSIFISSRNIIDVNQDISHNIMEILSRNGRVIEITDGRDTIEDPKYSKLQVPSISSCYYHQMLISLVVIQTLAYEVATLKGYDVDKPRNLAKTVTVN